MTPFRFGDAPRQLFGIHHAPQGPDRGHAVVVCSPFGQEAIRCHRMQRVLCERLARAGFHAMRFDYFATGDSDGDDSEGSLEAWVEDIGRARSEAARRSGGAPVSLFGMRLGGTLAALSAARSPAERLVVWDPVIDGRGYLAEVARQHASEAAEENEVVEPRPGAGGADGEALGFPLGAGLQRSIGALDANAFEGARAASVGLLVGSGSPGVEAVRAALARAGGALREQAIATSSVWSTDEAMNSAYVPVDALNAVVAMFSEGP